MALNSDKNDGGLEGQQYVVAEQRIVSAAKVALGAATQYCEVEAVCDI